MSVTAHRRGSALTLTIVVSVVLTGMAMTLAWLGSTHATMAGQIPKMDASYYAAEAGASHAIWKFKHDNTWRATSSNPFTGSISMYGLTWNYSVTCTDSIGDSLLAWKFDEYTGSTTADSTGNGNTGIFHGGVSWHTPGRSGACIRLDGIDGYVDCGNNPDTNLTGDMSFSAWVKMNSGYYDQKIGGNQNGSYGGYKLCIYNSKAEFEVRDANNKPHLNRDMTGGTILTMGTWYHILGVYSESGHWIKTYVNGQLDRHLQGNGTGTGQTDVPVNALASTTGNFVMGREPWESLYYFDGWMDDIRVWNRALSDAEAKTLYDTTVAIHSNASSGTISNFADMTCSIPTPPAPTIPAVTSQSDITLINVTINGDLSVKGDVIATTGSSVVNGNLNYTGKYPETTHLTVSDKTNAANSISVPDIDYAYLQNQAANWGKVVNGDSTSQTFSFNSLGGNKVIWIKGNLKDPIVTIGGTYAAGGTFIVDGNVSFTSGSTSLGIEGYPVYIVSKGDVVQSGGNLTLIGAIYAAGTFSHKTCTVTGPIVAKAITNNAMGTCTFSGTSIPWFDNRALPQQPTLPLYTFGHKGIGP
jgi:hypothetical protein